MNKDYLYDNYRLVDFYDDMYCYEEDFNLWREYIKPGMRILEIACGSGRLTKLIAESFEDVTIDALDYSKEMLGLLTNKMPSFNTKAGTNINPIEADMRYYTSEIKYDIIIIPSNSLNHIETNIDMQNVIASVYSLLKDGGYFLFDILNPIFQFLINKDKKWRFGEIYLQKKTGKYFYSDERNEYDYATQINNVEYRYYYCEKDGTKLPDSPTYRMDIKVRLYYPQEMDYYINNSLFKVVAKYDWYNKKEYTGKTSEQIYVLQK